MLVKAVINIKDRDALLLYPSAIPQLATIILMFNLSYWQRFAAVVYKNKSPLCYHENKAKCTDRRTASRADAGNDIAVSWVFSDADENHVTTDDRGEEPPKLSISSNPLNMWIKYPSITFSSLRPSDAYMRR